MPTHRERNANASGIGVNLTNSGMIPRKGTTIRSLLVPAPAGRNGPGDMKNASGKHGKVIAVLDFSDIPLTGLV